MVRQANPLDPPHDEPPNTFMRMMILIFALIPCMAASCPKGVDQSQVEDGLLSLLKRSPSESAARDLTGKLWDVWLTAPDAKSQKMLDVGLAFHAQGQFDAALGAYNDLVEYCPDYAEGYNQRAFVYYLTGRWALALADLERAIELSPRHLGALSGRGLTLMQLDRQDEAQKAFRKSLELNPWMPERALIKKPEGIEL